MIPPLSFLAARPPGQAEAGATTTARQPGKETLRAEQKAVEDRKLKIMARQERQHTRRTGRETCRSARLENMQKALRRLMEGGLHGPAMVALQTPSAAFASCGGQAAEVATGATDDAVPVSAAVVQVSTGDGAAAVTIRAVVAATGMSVEPEAETDTGRAMGADWADGAAERRMARAWRRRERPHRRGGWHLCAALGRRGRAGRGPAEGRAEAVVMLDRSLTDDWTVERGEDRLTLRFGAGLSITFEGLSGAGAIGVGRLERGQDITLIHGPPGLDRTV